MRQVTAVLDRVDQMALSTWMHHVPTPVAPRLPIDDDDLIDEWLASLSVAEFEGFLSGLADLR